ncbi:MAG: T9SS type A sorting domain-containing protein [bacterium]
MKNKHLQRFSVVVLILLLHNTNSFSQDTARIFSYNLLNYSGGEPKNQYFRKSIGYADPDILVVCEMISQAGVNDLLANVMNYYTPGIYSAGTFLDGPDTDNAIFYKTIDYTFVSNTPVHTDLRDINMFTLIHNLSRDTLRLFEVHLKASSGADNEAQRLIEVNAVRAVTNNFPAGTEFMILGDFNIYNSTESCYLRMLQIDAGNEGHFIDPYSLPGVWNQAAYSQYHSQSTRVRSFGGGATGGMDDRFDFILNSKSLTEEGRIKYIPGSLKPFGNDGNHYNDSINKRPNTSVPDSIADALHYASDHLPVYALYKFDVHPSAIRSISSSVPEDFKLYQNYPNPFNPGTIINYELKVRNNVTLKVYDQNGKEVSLLVNKRQNPGNYKLEFNAQNLSSGVYFYTLRVGNSVQTKSMIVLK